MGRGSSSPAGDIIFVRPDPGDWAGQLVARATDGPYCHCQVRISRYEVVEALARGVARDTLAAEPDAADVATLSVSLDPARLAHGLTWLLAQVGCAYGWLDIVGDAVGLLLPARLGSRTPLLVAPSRFDCSDLAARFLLLAGYEWLPDELAMDTSRVSPNGLAKALGVLKP